MIFAAFNGAALIHMFLTAPETKGKTLEEMDDVFDVSFFRRVIPICQSLSYPLTIKCRVDARSGNLAPLALVSTPSRRISRKETSRLPSEELPARLKPSLPKRKVDVWLLGFFFVLSFVIISNAGKRFMMDVACLRGGGILNGKHITSHTDSRDFIGML